MSVVSRASRKKSWQTVTEIVSLLDVLSDQEQNVAARLEQLRRDHGLSQEAAAHKVGVSNRQWQRWESGESEPRASNLARISSEFNVPVSDVVSAGTKPQLDRIEEKLDALLERLGVFTEETAAETEARALLAAGEAVERERAARARRSA